MAMADQDTVSVTEAARLLGTTNERIARLIKHGVLTSRVSNLDRRRRLIPREEVERILREEGPKPPKRRTGPETAARERPRPRTIGMYTGPIKVTSDEVDAYLAEHWTP
jgi:excisionase family DNA binding protein